MSLGKSKGELCLDKTVSGKTEEHITIWLYDAHFISSESFWGGGVTLYHDWPLDSKCTLQTDRKSINLLQTNN